MLASDSIQACDDCTFRARHTGGQQSLPAQKRRLALSNYAEPETAVDYGAACDAWIAQPPVPPDVVQVWPFCPAFSSVEK